MPGQRLLPTCRVFLQLMFRGLKDLISMHFWLGDHSQVFSSSALLQFCFLVHLRAEKVQSAENAAIN